ncbi:MAG: hypothetical protein ACJ76F_09650 [Bacteroidia bacterium]
MKNTGKEAVIRLVNGQRKYGNIIGDADQGNIHFLSFLNEQLFGEDNFCSHIEMIEKKEIHEIDLLLK